MLVPNEISGDDSEPNTGQIVSPSSGVATCVKRRKELDTRMSSSSRGIALTTLPILNKLPNSQDIGSKFQVSTKFSNSDSNNCTLQHFSLPSLTPKNSIHCSGANMCSSIDYSTKPMVFQSNFTRNTSSYGTRSWPLAGENCPGFKPLGYRTRPTFGERCLKSGDQWATPREEPGPTLPVLDLFTDDPIKRRSREIAKNDRITKPVKRVSWLRENRFPALIDAYNTHQGLYNIDTKSHNSIIGYSMSQETDFPAITSCKLNKLGHQKFYKNSGIQEVFEKDCSECNPQARISDASTLKSNSSKYHIHLPTTD